MKKILCILLAIVLCGSLCACTFTNEDGTSTIAGVAVEAGIGIVAKFLEGLLAIAGAFLLNNLSKSTKLKNTATALENLLTITRQTVGELQQVFVDDWKRENKDGKLTPAQIENLKSELLRLVYLKLDKETKDLIIAAGSDIDAIITGEAESFINKLKPILIGEGILPDEEIVDVQMKPAQEETE